MISIGKKLKAVLFLSITLCIVYVIGILLMYLRHLSNLKILTLDVTHQHIYDKEISKKLKRDNLKWYDIRHHRHKHPVLNDQLLNLHRRSEFPEDVPCPYLGVRKPINGTRQAENYTGITCVPHRPTEESCEEAIEIFGEISDLPQEECDETKYEELCTFLRSDKTKQKRSLQCDWSACLPRRPYIGEMSRKYGKVYWKYAPTDQQIEKIIYRSTKNGFNFVFFKCGSLKQVLVLPRNMHVSSAHKSQSRINVNIILIDSIARPHFYRSMPRTVKALRDVVYDDSVGSTVLDFELLQSVSQHTMDNLRPLYSGVTSGVYKEFSSKWRQSIKPLGIPILFGKFKKLGYQTLFQEEGCWYDSWGLMLTDVERYKTPKHKAGFAKRWKQLQKRWTNYFIDDFGMTHFTCEVVKKYSQTNDLDVPEKVCYNGDFISTYYLNYHLDYLNSIRQHANSVPLLHYLHLVTGHTSTGVRTRNDDVGLANYVTEVARDPNTLTIFMSDHGHSRTKYGQTVEGRFELFNPLMFVVLPENVARLLGKKQVTSLFENQRRLFTMLDVHRMLMAIHDPTKLRSTDYKVNGLLSVLPGNRTCKNLPLTPMTRCKCEGWDQRVEDNSPRHAWLAEFALGHLNNMIQKQFMKGRYAKSSGGYGSCLRLRGLETKNNVERQNGLDLITTMDITTESPLQNVKEVFQVMITTPLIPDEEIAYATLVKFDRHSLYSRYEHCADTGVDIKLCACSSNSSHNSKRTAEEVRRLAMRSVFSAETGAKELDESGCLLLLSRKQNFSISYEVANVCDETYILVFKGETYNMLLTAELPLKVLVEPKTIHFLLSATRYVVNDSFFNIETSFKVVETRRT